MVSNIFIFILILTISTCNTFRLPENLKPSLYNLKVKTFLENEFRFEGCVKIRFDCLNATSSIVLHASDLSIAESGVTVTPLQVKGDEAIEVVSHEHQLENQFYVITLAQPLQAGRTYHVTISYVAPLSTNLLGYYRSSYTDAQTGKTKWLAVSKFEPTHARRAFPCFDEPAMKARFRVVLERQRKFTSVSNMQRIASHPLADGWVRDEYAETMPMSTYLVAFMVSELASLESNQGRTKFRVWARPEAISQARYALDIAPRILHFFEQYFDVEYPLPKMDMVAVPDFGSGAMENWGFCTYRETTMLYEEGLCPASAKETVTRVVAHELAHQWFGNLVTMRWWDEIWLNEGFATYAAALGMDHVQPEWRSEDEQALSAMLAVFSMDALKSSRPVFKETKQASDIQQMFDPISYHKGAFLLRMMEHFLGKETFRRGVTRYLRTHMFSNAAQDALWASLEEQARLDASQAGSVVSGTGVGTVKQVMDSWTLQPGYAVLHVERDSKRRTATVWQARFLLGGSGNRVVPTEWWIPLSYTSSGTASLNETQPRAWLHATPAHLKDDPGQGAWLMLNLNATALYRVNYAAPEWRLVFAELRNEETRSRVPPLNRALLVLDAFDLSRAGLLQYDVALDVLRYLCRERHPLPWRAAFASLAHLARMTRHTEGLEPFKSMMRSLLSPLYAELGDNPFREANTKQASRLGTRVRALLLQRTSYIQGLLQQGSWEARRDVTPRLRGRTSDREHKETVPETKLRAQLLGWACRMGVADCEQRAADTFTTWQQQNADPDKVNPVPIDLRGVVYCCGVRLGGQQAWQFVWKRYLAANVATEKRYLLDALGCTTELEVLEKYLSMVLDKDSQIRQQDAYDVFSAVAKGSGFYVARDFFIEHIKDLYEYFAPKTVVLGYFFTSISASMNTEEDLIQMRGLAREHASLLEGAWRSVRLALETISVNVRWRGRHHQQLVQWLAAHANASSFCGG